MNNCSYLYVPYQRDTADDIVIISRTLKSLQEATGTLERAARRMALEINQAKTKYMICGTKKKYAENVFKVKHVTERESTVLCIWEH